MPSISIHRLNTILPGTVLRVWHGVFYHYGILGPYDFYGQRVVISHSGQKGGLVIEPFAEFARGRTVISDGYIGGLQPEQVLQRAMQHKATPYSLASFNCEHLVRYAHGLEPVSPQMKLATAITLCLGLFAICRR